MTKPVYFPSMTRKNLGIIVPNEQLYLAYMYQDALIVAAPLCAFAVDTLNAFGKTLGSQIYDIKAVTWNILRTRWALNFSILAKKASADGVKAGLQVIHRDDPSASGFVGALWWGIQRGDGNKDQYIDIPFIVKDRVTACQAPIGGEEVLAYRPQASSYPVVGLKCRH